MTVPTSALRRAREKAGINQAMMAKRLGVSSNSVVSRMEKGETTDQHMAERYLRAIDTPESLDMLDFYSRHWEVSKRPGFGHPDREALWAAEIALQELNAFEQSQGFDDLLRSPLNRIRSELISTAEYVGRTDHTLAWIGAVGIGKTTALSHITNLVLPGPGMAPRPIFPASGGRTTTSEVVVRTGPTFSIAVDARDPDEVRQLVREMVEAIALGRGGLATEIDRAIRNMAMLQKFKDPEDPKVIVDPVRQMVAVDGTDIDDVVHAIVTRMRLEERTSTQLMLGELDGDGLVWIDKTVAGINFGKDPRFSLPDRVTVFVPRSVVRKSPYELTFIDTKGIMGTADREDLQRLNADNRTLSILCCAFNQAPGQDMLELLSGMKDMGIDAVERRRVVLLVLPRGDEPLKLVNGMGEPVETLDEGLTLREGQIEETLLNEGFAGIPVVYFNVVQDDAAQAWTALSHQVDQIRRRQLERLERFTTLAEELRTNADVHRIEQARFALAQEAVAIANEYRLPGPIRLAHQRLVKELRDSHPSTIAAAAARNGSWLHFDMHHMVGTGVRADANLRTTTLIATIKGRLDGLRHRFQSNPEAVALVETLVDDLADWKQDFLNLAASIGRNAFKTDLDGDLDFWAKLRRRYGQGSGYREDIALAVEAWFEASERNSARAKVETRLAEAWREAVMDKLIASTAIDIPQD